MKDSEDLGRLALLKEITAVKILVVIAHSFIL